MSRRPATSKLTGSPFSRRKGDEQPPSYTENVPASLPPVRVSHDRIIRTQAGLRPFRPSGFVVRAEKFDSKTIIHNYGHGGAGITLSWGTSQLALEETAGLDLSHCAVLGCGIVGLTQARLLQLRGFRPTIYAKDLPPETTSNIAGGLWDPITLFDLPDVTTRFRNQLEQASKTAFRRFQSFAGDEYGVEWLEVFTLSKTPIPHPAADHPLTPIEALYPEHRELKGDDNPFPHIAHVQRKMSMRIQTSTFLNTLMRDFLIAGGSIVVRDFASRNDIAALPESVIFNCTGLGAKALFDDRDIIPVRGQLAILLPQPEIRYTTNGPGDIYMVSRKDGIWVGGTFERGQTVAEAQPEDIGRIVTENRAVFAPLPGFMRP